MSKSKSAISLISYDAHYLPTSISKYYKYVDEIILGLDKNRTTWSGNRFTFDEDKIFQELQLLDTDDKIHIIEDNFVKSDIAIENDNYERNVLKSSCTTDWVISIDADEIMLNPKEFFLDYLDIVEPYRNDYDILATWATPYKIIDDSVLVICDEQGMPFFGEKQGVMTSINNTYTYARWTNNNKTLRSPLVLLHWSLARTEQEMQQKVRNIGHSDIADKDPFLQIWGSTTLDNYHELRNFKTSGLGTAQWPALREIPLKDVEKYYLSNITEAYK